MSGRGGIKQLLAIDWDSRNLRVVHALLGKREVKIDRLLSVAIPSGVDPSDPAQMGLHIRRVLDQESIYTKHAVVDIPRDQAILKTLQLPVQDKDALPSMVEIQVAKELPFPVDQAVIDYAVAGVGSEESTDSAKSTESTVADVLVAVVRQEVLSQYASTFQAAGLKLDRIGLRPFANRVALCKLLEFSMPERVLFIDVGPSLTEIDVLHNSTLVFSRAASVSIDRHTTQAPRLSIVPEPRGGDAPDTPADAVVFPGAVAPTPQVEEKATTGLGVSGAVNALVLEVTRSIEAYRASDSGAAIDLIVLGGDEGIEEELAEALQKRLGVNTELYNPAGSFGWEPDEGAAACAFAATLGLALGQTGEGALHLDFLHPKRGVSTAQRRLRKAPVAAAVVLLFATATAVGLTQWTKVDRQTLARIDARIEELEAKRNQYRKFLAIMEDVRDFDAGQHDWIDVLYDVFSMLPPHEEFVVNKLEIRREKDRIILNTQAKDRDAPVQLIRTLEAFRREGKEKPRFKVSMGPQKEKRAERYPFVQDLRIQVLKDEPRKKKRAKN
ncbi:MAG: pilus assembly protein PilM [Planctomycetes bacterium]|nr:pilus assembly protein PilM [Planctomycetota bacterium]